MEGKIPGKPIAAPARTSRVRSDSDPRCVLIVEDNQQHADLAAAELASAGIEAMRRSSAEDALALLRQAEVDVVLSDSHLPGITGLELLDEIRRSWPHVPVVIVTGMGNERLAVAALKAGASDYLIKEARLGYLEMLPLVVRNA